MTESKSLYQLTQEEAELLMEFEWALNPEPDPETGEIKVNEESAMALLYVQMQSTEKIERMVRIVEEFENTAMLAKAEYDAAKEIIERKNARKKSCESAAKRIKGMILRYMQETGKQELTAGSRLLKVAKSAKAVLVDATASLMTWPDEFVRVKYEADKPAIKAADKEGRPIPAGCEVVQGRRLMIK